MSKTETYVRLRLANELADIQGSGRNNELEVLTAYEKALIYKYSTDGYESLNEALRVNGGANTSVFGQLLHAALDKLPGYAGLVYKGVQLTSNELGKYGEAHSSKAVLTEPTFISATKSRLTAMAFRKNVLFIISSKTGERDRKNSEIW